MITAVLDTNVIVGAAIGSAQATAGRILDAYFDGKYRLAFSPTTSDELLHVLSLPMIRLRHGKAFNACYDPSARQHNWRRGSCCIGTYISALAKVGSFRFISGWRLPPDA
jgi:predicted nucleic acid-binding protein